MTAERNEGSVYIIAEAGVNHNGDTDIALELIDAAAEAGADAVKFQTFKATELVTANAATAGYQSAATGDATQLGMLRQLELDIDQHRRLLGHCQRRKIDFMSTGFDLESVKLLDSLGVTRFKVPSGDITNYPLLCEIAAMGKPTIVSTGMSDLDEIRSCIDLMLSEGLSRDRLSILHCNTEYPTPMRDVNLRAMKTIALTFPGVEVGYSDHTVGNEVPIAAVALGARIIEKHFTVDKSLTGPDHSASLDPSELIEMVRSIRNVTEALGARKKTPTPSEIPNRAIVRRSLVASRAIQKGEVFTPENLTAKRPGTGRSPMDWPNVIGTASDRDYVPDDLIK